MKVSVILPTYNERGNIINLIRDIRGYIQPLAVEEEIVVVDDNSPDGTGNAVQEEFHDDERVRVFIRKEERGLATAIRYGIERSTGDLIVVMDTDYNHHPSVIPQMIDFSKYYDFIVGSRYMIGGGMENRSRHWGSFWYNFFVRLVLNTRVQDNLSGYLCVQRHVVQSMDLSSVFYGYGDYFFRMIYWAAHRNLRILEIPVFYKNRMEGASKTNLVRLLGSYTLAVIRLRLSTLW